MARIFLCHASEDKPQVRDVYQRLKALGFEPWLDEEDILPGQDWDYEIEKALETSDFVLVFLSTRSVEKVGYVQREFRRALYHAEEMPEGFIHTIPVKLDDCEVPRRFSRNQWANLYEEGAFDRIVRSLHYGLQQRGQPLPKPYAVGRTWTNSIGMEFVLIAAGTFLMGSHDGEPDEQPVHQATISQPFYLGTYEVTQGQWKAVMGTNPSTFTGDCNLPVENVSWEDAQEFIRRLNAKEGGTRYRLPTEAEWEYASRAGSQTAYSFGDDPSQLGVYGWYYNNSGNKTHPVGQRTPNAWGLYDMHGNVWEWIQDWYGKYSPEPVTDPQGPESGSYRMFRGGGWGHGARYCQSAARHGDAPGNRSGHLGFRLLRIIRAIQVGLVQRQQTKSEIVNEEITVHDEESMGMDNSIEVTREIQVPIHFDGKLFTAELADEIFEGEKRYYLMIKVEIPRELIRQFELMSKVGAREDIDNLRSAAIPGVRLYLEETPPDNLPQSPRSWYFCIDHQHDMWQRIKQLQNISVYCDLPPETEMILFAVPRT